MSAFVCYVHILRCATPLARHTLKKRQCLYTTKSGTDRYNEIKRKCMHQPYPIIALFTHHNLGTLLLSRVSLIRATI